ncbi:hypothetical protein ARAM_003826 [Aspergillus rambellii]|uniref:T6SS Phospholipase effector Tle1-like catalytic domain-containing protein n=1 Tax=Aspergillus rambellii TaxID=308745 RepID=A0A0F8UMQ0_9EURO|nr:hypothetical protein ARAM_003826 [Aspergillus rambellii]
MTYPCECSPTQELVLCFDGTGNTFVPDGSESNILKIFGMLDRNKEDRYCYYQPGIGTDITPGAFANVAFRNLPTNKILDQALAASFDRHVIKGYRFLARRWIPGSRIYLFGFSRGAYTARFLNEMLDFVGLISADNEETIPSVWRAFTRWKFARPGPEREEAKRCLELCRTRMCRPIGYVHFLGLFDTVNSVAEFNRSYDGSENEDDGTILPNPRILRHAVSIDERRIKFQPVIFEKMRPSRGPTARPGRISTWAGRGDEMMTANLALRGRCGDGSAAAEPSPNMNPNFEEVYFAGDHSDVGGGWPPLNGNRYTASQIPLMWMVEEAQRAGLTFDPKQLRELGCFEPQEESLHVGVVQAAEQAPLHDSLQYESGNMVETLFWRVLECLPFKRPKVAPDGAVRMSRWHTWGTRRPLPPGAKIHASVLRRLRNDPKYRPYNLGLGNRPKEIDASDEERDIGKWQHIEHAGFCDYYVRIKDESTRTQMSSMIDQEESHCLDVHVSV